MGIPKTCPNCRTFSTCLSNNFPNIGFWDNKDPMFSQDGKIFPCVSRFLPPSQPLSTSQPSLQAKITGMVKGFKHRAPQISRRFLHIFGQCSQFPSHALTFETNLAVFFQHFSCFRFFGITFGSPALKTCMPAAAWQPEGKDVQHSDWSCFE